MSGLSDFLILVAVALAPALAYLVWVRDTERYRTEAWSTVLGAFAYGAIFSTIVAGTLEGIIVAAGTSLSKAVPGPEFIFLNGNSTAGLFFLVLVVAPFIEEAMKASGVHAYRRRIRLLADGPVLGASVGFGFGFLETLLYGLGAYVVGGLAAGLLLIIVRSFSSVLLHGSSTAIFGIGYARGRLLPGSGPGAGRGYLTAVGMHSTFNFLASIGVILAAAGVPSPIAAYGDLLALLVAVLFAVAAFGYVRAYVSVADYPALHGGGRFQPKPKARSVPPPGGPRRT